MTEANLTLARLRELLHYDPQTGVFTWVKTTSNRAKVGAPAGGHNGNGYIRISIDGRYHYAHRLAWLWVHGDFPAAEIDHKDGDRSNNRIGNLRMAEHRENSQNQALRSTNKSGFHGVSRHANTGKWVASIHVRGKKKHLGLYAMPEAAAQAYLRAKAQMHEFQPVPRDVRIA